MHVLLSDCLGGGSLSREHLFGDPLPGEDSHGRPVPWLKGPDSLRWWKLQPLAYALGQMSSIFLSILFYCLIIPVLWFVDYILSVFTLLPVSCILIVLSWQRFNGFLLSHFYFYPWLVFYLVPSSYSTFILSFIFMLFIFISALLFAFSAVFNDFCLDSSFCW